MKEKSKMFNPKYEMSEVAPGVFFVEVDGNNDLAYTFLRVQEFYESVNPDIQGKQFTWQQYVNWYSSQSKTGTFSYGEDWRGFNIPSDAIYNCYKMNLERTEYDVFFLSLVEMIEAKIKEEGLEKFYVIGARKGDSGTLDHEIAHGFFTVNQEYKKEMVALVNAMPTESVKYLENYLTELGYASSVHQDEIQAYMSTGLRANMNKELLEDYTKEFEQVFEYHKNTVHA